jgi:hypothetical protein
MYGYKRHISSKAECWDKRWNRIEPGECMHFANRVTRKYVEAVRIFKSCFDMGNEYEYLHPLLHVLAPQHTSRFFLRHLEKSAMNGQMGSKSLSERHP